jgi:hypothetical protein
VKEPGAEQDPEQVKTSETEKKHDKAPEKNPQSAPLKNQDSAAANEAGAEKKQEVDPTAGKG